MVKSSLPHDSLEVLPYRALLKTGSLEERKEMVMDLYESGRPEATQVLMSAIQDPEERVRLLAAQALEKITEKSHKAIQQQALKIDQDPKNPDLRLEMANLLYERALRSGYAGETRRATYLEAAAHLNLALPDLEEFRKDAARIRLGEIYGKLGRYQHGREILQPILPSSAPYTRARFLIAELSVALDDWDTFKQEIEKLSRLPLLNEMKTAVEFWRNPA